MDGDGELKNIPGLIILCYAKNEQDGSRI